MSFAGRLVLGTALVLILAVGVLVWASEVLLRRDLETEIRHSLEREARLVREGLSVDSLDWQSSVRRLANEIGHRITLIDSTGRVRAESDPAGDSLPRLENHLSRPEVQQALHEGTGFDRRTSVTVGRPLMYVAVRSRLGVVRVAASLEQVDTIVQAAQRSVLWAAVLALALGGILALVAAGSVARPLTAITTAAGQIASGAQPRFPHSGIPDIDSLVRALKEMNLQLAERFDELRRERAESAALVESMVEGVIAADGRGRIVTANPAARRLLGYEPDEVLPDLAQLFRFKSAREVVDAVLAGSSVLPRELDLDDRAVVVSARSLPAGGAVLVIHDVTELRRLEAMRRDFVANVSHELKTPLTSISGYAETLLGELPEGETSRRFLQVILSNARRMQRLVDGLLDLSRIESGGWRPNPEPVDPGAAVREAWAPFAERATARQIGFTLDAPADTGALLVDPDALRQVLTNLLDNALRYTPVGGLITVQARREEEEIALSVSDTGSGIPRDHLPRIFERFYRADPSRSREEGGTGLGLAIVKHLVEAHEGRVEAESEIGRGATIRCWLPVEPALDTMS
ncbi:MAG: ATP-binding protein [Gemmatimonadales bacterium]